MVTSAGLVAYHATFWREAFALIIENVASNALDLSGLEEPPMEGSLSYKTWIRIFSIFEPGNSNQDF